MLVWDKIEYLIMIKVISLPIMILVMSFVIPEPKFTPLIFGVFIGSFWTLWVTDKKDT